MSADNRKSHDTAPLSQEKAGNVVGKDSKDSKPQTLDNGQLDQITGAGGMADVTLKSPNWRVRLGR